MQEIKNVHNWVPVESLKSSLNCLESLELLATGTASQSYPLLATCLQRTWAGGQLVTGDATTLHLARPLLIRAQILKLFTSIVSSLVPGVVNDFGLLVLSGALILVWSWNSFGFIGGFNTFLIWFEY